MTKTMETIELIIRKNKSKYVVNLKFRNLKKAFCVCDKTLNGVSKGAVL